MVGCGVGNGLALVVGLAVVVIRDGTGAIEGATLAWHAPIKPATITARAARPHIMFSSPMASLESRPRLETSRAVRCVSQALVFGSIACRLAYHARAMTLTPTRSRALPMLDVLPP